MAAGSTYSLRSRRTRIDRVASGLCKMRSALITYGFFILIIQEGNGAHDDFRPTPIPLTDWHDRRHGRASTLHETFRTDTPTTVAAVPAHYWEDALRHSVYLTLVRDKIDQLIAKGEVISAENDHHKPVSKEVDDHDLWEKIKSAPFDRLKEEEPSVVGDVTIMAKGRLLEEKGGFRFTEDDKTQDKCKDEYCMQGVKAVWSVKRVRQRDQEMSPGRYHYEITFSVISQPPTKKKKPYENPIRTFTVRESPSPVVPLKAYDIERIQPPHHTPRPARAIWFHKNIVPPQQRIKSKPYGALDRIFSSLFSDDDDSSYEPPATKYKPNPYIQHSKVGYVGSPSDQHQQINPPHHYRPPPVKYNRPPHGSQPNTIQQQHHQQYQQQQEQYQPQQQQYQQQQEQYQPQQQKYQPQQQKYQPQHQPYQPQQHQYQVTLQQPQHQHFDVGPSSTFGGHGHYNSHDRRIDPHSTVKSTRPPVLPTPLPPLSTETTYAISFDSAENTTNLPDFTPHKTNNRFKPTTNKVNYFSDHVRPPIYNAPPGVFVTMDKKPFKPMPPLKLIHTNKGHKTNRPVDFRPSPQLHENQPTEENSFTDSAFRPITVHYTNSSLIENFESNKKPEHKHRKTTSHGKKPSKKHNVKSRVSSTIAPEIITAQSLVDDDMDAMYWTNVLNSFTKTTPMASQVEKDNVSEETTPLITSTQETDYKIAENITTTTTTTTPYLEVVSLSTSPKPIKRTRPMPKFTKPDKIRKHKRITPTSTSTTTTSIPTKDTTFKSTERPVIRKTVDLMPQASSAPMTGQKNKTSTSTSSTISTTTTTITTTSAPPTTTTTKASTTAKSTSTTTEKKQSSTTTLARNRNRFRQSTLFLKGTSIKHDRWSVIGIQKNNTTTAPSAVSSSYRRKGSNFQGYSSTTSRNAEKVETSTSSMSKSDEGNFESSTNYENYESNSVIPLVQSEEENDIDEDDEATTNDSSDESEYVFHTTTSAIDRSSDVTSFEDATGNTVAQAPQKFRCKKKKNNQDSENDLVKEIGSRPFVTTAPTTTISETETTNDILSEIFKFNFDNDIANDTKIKPDLDSQASIQHGSYHKMDNDLKDFLDILNDKHDDTEDSFDDHYSDDDTEFEDVEDREDDKDDEDDNSDTYDSDDSGNVSSRHNRNSKPKKPFSFLDLLV